MDLSDQDTPERHLMDVEVHIEVDLDSAHYESVGNIPSCGVRKDSKLTDGITSDTHDEGNVSEAGADHPNAIQLASHEPITRDTHLPNESDASLDITLTTRSAGYNVTTDSGNETAVEENTSLTPRRRHTGTVASQNEVDSSDNRGRKRKSNITSPSKRSSDRRKNGVDSSVTSRNKRARETESPSGARRARQSPKASYSSSRRQKDTVIKLEDAESAENSRLSHISKLSAYRIIKGDPEFLQSYKPPNPAAMRLGSIVAPTRKEIKSCRTCAKWGPKIMSPIEKSLYQMSLLRSRAFSVAWGHFMDKVNLLVRDSIGHGATTILKLLGFNSVLGTDLQLIVADTGVSAKDRAWILDILIRRIEGGNKDCVVVKARTSLSVQSCLEYILVQLRMKSSTGRYQKGEVPSLDQTVRKNIVQHIAEMYKWRYRNKHLVIIIDRITNDLNELLYIFYTLKRAEGLPVSCILCSNSWQTHLEQQLSQRVYDSLCIVNCDAFSVNKVSEDILKTILCDPGTQCFIPQLIELEDIWNTLYDEEMSIYGLVRRVYDLYDNFYGNTEFSFVCMPDLINLKADTKGDNNSSRDDGNDSTILDLHSKFALLFCGAHISEDYEIYLQYRLNRGLALESLCLYELPCEAMKLLERRISMQLGMSILYELTHFIPDYSTPRLRLSLISQTLHSRHSKIRVEELAKKLCRIIVNKEGKRLAEVRASLKAAADRFLSVYPTVVMISQYLGIPEKYDLLKECSDAIQDQSSQFSVAIFVEHALSTLLIPTIQGVTTPGINMMITRPKDYKHGWDILSEIKADRTCTGFSIDVKELIGISERLCTKSLGLWEMFCLFYDRHSGEGLASVFVRFSIALDTLTHVLGYYTYTPHTTTSTMDMREPAVESTQTQLAFAIKKRLSRFKLKRIHLGVSS